MFYAEKDGEYQTMFRTIIIQDEEEKLMLYTCWPVNTVGFKSRRYVIYTKLVGVELNES